MWLLIIVFALRYASFVIFRLVTPFLSPSPLPHWYQWTPVASDLRKWELGQTTVDHLNAGPLTPPSPCFLTIKEHRRLGFSTSDCLHLTVASVTEVLSFTILMMVSLFMS